MLSRRPLPFLRRSTLAAAVAALVTAAPALAQNPREVPIGGRTATMGGAATAAGNDSAMPYLNPAGMAGVPGDVFGISASLYGYTNRSFDKFFFPEGVDPGLGRVELEDESFVSRSVTDMPSSVMYFKRLGPANEFPKQHLGLALVVPSARRTELVATHKSRLPDLAGSIQLSESISDQRTDYWIGPSYAIAISERLRLGASLFAVYSRVLYVRTNTSFMELAGGAATTSGRGNSSQEANALSVAPVLGFQLEVAPKWWLGAGAAIPSFAVTGAGAFSASSDYTTNDPVSGLPEANTNAFSGRLDYRATHPLRLNAGIARDDRQGFSIAADVHYYHERKEATVTEGVIRSDEYRSGEVGRHFSRRQRTATDLTSIVDVSLGVELALSPAVAARLGGFSDLANTPELTGVENDLRVLRLDRFGGSAGVGLTFGTFDTTFGVVYTHGAGKYGALDTLGPRAGNVHVVPIGATEDSVLFVMSAAVTSEEAKKTIRDMLPVQVEVNAPGLRPIAPAAPSKPAPAPPPPANPPPPTPAAPPAVPPAPPPTPPPPAEPPQPEPAPPPAEPAPPPPEGQP